jgi:hypothetical protein
MSESITKTLVGGLAVAVLFWVFWNPATETTKAKPKSDKTEQVAKKKKKSGKELSNELSKKIRNAKKKRASRGSKGRNNENVSLKKLDPPDGSGAFLVTGSVKSVRLRAEDGEMFKPGIVPTGRYQILTRGKSGIEEHGHVVFEDGDRQRIDCDDDGCRPWKPTKK